ncbi:YxeA family protein [Lederbergia galactosidilytica]|uniref:YxeA family protein n=1 Tax=Lederbergia galactosidilytica TaxID=217031 RepID=A0A0Q9XSM2_9BACI|nr:YxeA family protein [Lederbergia galactosidilytica]KRG11125.1 hypothetical protein ACA29_19240 [Lederbergia galactosidilytica]MBP1914437.1 uncharacterized protein (TIGR01655 family) [Lederbergia galactosidilytica]OAK75768.1 hypothetical protein ABB05_01045 [Lederbergia galactosidilytica]
MKSWIIGLLTIFIIVGGLVAASLIFHNEVTDRFNPLVPQKDVYVQIMEKGTPRSQGGYDYTLSGFDESGIERKVTFYAAEELRNSAYLRVDAKGKYIKTWEEVQWEELPNKVSEKLENQAPST